MTDVGGSAEERIRPDNLRRSSGGVVLCDAQEDTETLRRGIRAYRQARYDEALALLEVCAERGSREARRLLSRMYYAGQGVAADPTRYLYWLARAAESGDPAARAKLKRRYRSGDLPDALLADPFVRRLTGRTTDP